MESGFWCHPEIRQQTVSLDLQAELWKDLFCLRKFMRHWEAEGQLGGSGERPELLGVGLRQKCTPCKVHVHIAWKSTSNANSVLLDENSETRRSEPLNVSTLPPALGCRMNVKSDSRDSPAGNWHGTWVIQFGGW